MLKKYNIRLLKNYCICLPILVLLLIGHSQNIENWEADNEANIIEYSGMVVDTFVVGRSTNYVVIELPSGKKITMKDNDGHSGQVTLYGITENGTNYYSFIKGGLYTQINSGTTGLLVFLVLLLGAGPAFWYAWTLIAAGQKGELREKNYVIDTYDAKFIMDDSQWIKSGERTGVDGRDGFIIKRGLLGNILLLPDLSFDEYRVLYKSIVSHSVNLTKDFNAGRILFIVKIENVDDKILEQLEEALVFDKVFARAGSFQVTFIDYERKKGYFGGTKEPGKTLLYKDTWKFLIGM